MLNKVYRNRCRERMRFPSSSSSHRLIISSLAMGVCFITRLRGADGFQYQYTPSNGITGRGQNTIYLNRRIIKPSPSNIPVTSFTVLRVHKNDEGNSTNNDNAPVATSTLSSLLTENPSRSIAFSAIMALCGAALGPFLDSFHSAFGVLQYDEPITAALWGSSSNPALITAWWVPILFGVAGWLIGWLYIALDAITNTQEQQSPAIVKPSPPKILVGISLFTFQYWLSGVLVATEIVDRTGILNIMSVYAAVAFLALDGSLAGFITSAATALGGPLIEVGLLSISRLGIMPGGYHYNDLGETGFFPLWIIPVYFLGGPAVGTSLLPSWFLFVVCFFLTFLLIPPLLSNMYHAIPPCDKCNE